MVNGPWHEVRRVQVVRGGVGLLAVTDGVAASWALLAPASFYRDFPAPGFGWVSSLPPYNEHLLTDFGEALLAVAVALAVSAVMNERRVMRVALIAALVQAIPHLVFHLADRGMLPAGQYVLSVTTLGVLVVLTAALLILCSRATTGEGSV